MAVLPTPGSPTRTGLFLVRRESTCITRSISVSRPTSTSNLPSRASCVRLRPNWSRTAEPPASDASALFDELGCEEVLPVPEFSIMESTVSRIFETSTPMSSRMEIAMPSSSWSRPRSMCSVPM